MAGINDRVWLLGPDSPTMRFITNMLVKSGETVACAVDARGQRVNADSAYSAVDCWWPDSCTLGPAWGSITHMVGCAAAPTLPGGGTPPLRADVVHINKNTQPDEQTWFFVKSMVGQVALQLRDLGIVKVLTSKHSGSESKYALMYGGSTIKLCKEVLAAAAADYCLPDAYAGRCGGLDIPYFHIWRTKQLAEYTACDTETVTSRLKEAAQTLRDGLADADALNSTLKSAGADGRPKLNYLKEAYVIAKDPRVGDDEIAIAGEYPTLTRLAASYPCSSRWFAYRGWWCVVVKKNALSTPIADLRHYSGELPLLCLYEAAADFDVPLLVKESGHTVLYNAPRQIVTEMLKKKDLLNLVVRDVNDAPQCTAKAGVI